MEIAGIVAIILAVTSLVLYFKVMRALLRQSDDIDVIAKQVQQLEDRKSGCKGGYPGCPGGCAGTCYDQTKSDTVMRF